MTKGRLRPTGHFLEQEAGHDDNCAAESLQHAHSLAVNFRETVSAVLSHELTWTRSEKRPGATFAPSHTVPLDKFRKLPGLQCMSECSLRMYNLSFEGGTHPKLAADTLNQIFLSRAESTNLNEEIEGRKKSHVEKKEIREE